MADRAIRSARREDAPAIAALVRGGFDASTIDMFIYGASGIERYIAAQIDEADHATDTHYFVADVDGSPAACIEMRVLADRLWLNYIAVSARARRQRLGSRLLAHAVAALRGGAHALLGLDVLEHNAPAVAWYDALGLALASTTLWYGLATPRSAGTSRAIVAGWPQARLCQRELGFSQLAVTTPSRSYTVGQLGAHWFRLTDPAALTDLDLTELLARLAPERELLALLPEHAPVPAGARLLARMQRRTASLDAVIAALPSAG